MPVPGLKSRIAPTTTGPRARTRGGGTNFRGEKYDTFPSQAIISPEWDIELETLPTKLGYRTT